MSDRQPEITQKTGAIDSIDDLPADARLALLEDLRRRHIAYATDRLTNGDAKALLRSNLRAGIDAFLASKVEDVVSIDALAKLVDAAVSAPSIEKMWRPAMKMFAMLEIARLREDSAPLGDYVPDRARADLRDLLAQKGIMPAKLIREIAAHEASETVMREVLDRAITDFQSNVNPFTSDWGLPGLLKKMGPLGMGLAKSLETVQHEFEKRVQPELKRFLHGAAKKALKSSAEYLIDNADKPPFVALRRELFAWALDQPTNEILTLNEPVVELAESAMYETTKHILTTDATKKRRRATLEMLFGAHRKQTVADALAVYGIAPVIDVDALAAALITPVIAWVKSPGGQRFLDEIVGGFYDAELARV